MSDTPWPIVREIFEEIVELAPDARASALAERCGDNVALRAAVQDLLDADSKGDGPLDSRGSAAALAVEALAAAQPGASIGGFRVTRLLDAGGMGAVYEARQHNPPRAVALKVLRPELCSGAALQRFRVEAEVLGRMQHPGIAEVFAAGVHEVQAAPFRWEVPWYAMELLDGALTLTAYAQRAGLDVGARVTLVRKVCDAVQHAHARGVIHRDLKPGNVLVDAAGHPKVIDFGVARASSGSGDTLRTEPGAVLGTPSYMAPEQFTGVGADVDVRADVWALGVILFELLAGRVPYAIEGPAQAARAFDATPSPLRSLCPTASIELEWVVGKALAVDRDQRYPSVAALADDLDRVLCHEAVAAAPPGRGYRLRKALRRHRALVASAAAVFVALAGGVVATGLALARVNAEQRLARQQLERTHGLVQVLRGATFAAQGRDRGASGTIADLVARLDEQARDPSLPALVRGAVLEHLAAMQFRVGEYAASAGLFRDALADLESGALLGGIEEIQTRAGLSEALRLTGDYEGSAQQLDAAIHVAEAALARDDPMRLSLQRRQAFALLNRGRKAEGIALCREIAAVRSERFGPDAAETAESIADLGAALADAGDVDEAIAVLADACARCEATFGVAAEKTLNARVNLCTALLRDDQHERALAVAEAALAAAESEFADDHPVRIMLAEQCAKALRAGGRIAEAAPRLAECVRSYGARFPPHHPRLLDAVAALGTAWLDLGDGDAAAEAVAPFLADHPAQPEVVQRALVAVRNVHARALQRRGLVAEAESELLLTWTRAVERLGREHASARATARWLAELCAEQQRAADAERWRTLAGDAAPR